MSSFSLRQLQEFSAQAARQRAEIFGASGGMQIGTVSGSDVTWSETFDCAFAKLATSVELILHGKIVHCTAKVLVQTALGLTITPATLFKDVATGDVYDVGRIGETNASMAEIPVFLIRREG